MKAISEDTQNLIIDWVEAQLKNGWRMPDESGRRRKGAWGIPGRAQQCIECGSADSPHYAKQLCKSCYHKRIKRVARKKDPKAVRVQCTLHFDALSRRLVGHGDIASRREIEMWIAEALAMALVREHERTST